MQMPPLSLLISDTGNYTGNLIPVLKPEIKQWAMKNLFINIYKRLNTNVFKRVINVYKRMKELVVYDNQMFMKHVSDLPKEKVRNLSSFAKKQK